MGDHGLQIIPVRIPEDAVILWLAKLAKVLVWTHRLVNKSNTATMLPHFASVALDEEVASIFGQGFRTKVESMSRILFGS